MGPDVPSQCRGWPEATQGEIGSVQSTADQGLGLSGSSSVQHGQKAQQKALVKKVQESQKNGQAALKQVTAHLAGKTGAKTELAKVLTQACTALKDLKSKKQLAAKAMKH